MTPTMDSRPPDPVGEHARLARLGPALVTLLMSLTYLGVVLLQAGGDPLTFARIGTRYGQGDPQGTEGYDGQFNYFIALNPSPSQVAPHLDIPAYRYQRILYPLLARALALGDARAIPWTLVGVNLVSLTVAALLLGELLAARGANRWYALLFSSWAGILSAARLDLSEPLSFALLLLALWIEDRVRRNPAPAAVLTWSLMALSLFAKETMLPFALAWACWAGWKREWRESARRGMALIPYLVFQLWLSVQFGRPGLGSGGAGNTTFELIPLGGFFRIGAAGLPVLAAMAAFLLPGIILPAVWGIVAPLLSILRHRLTLEGLILLLNALMVAWAPFSTFREPLGVARFASGMIVGVLLFAARAGERRPLRYGLVWGAYLALLFK